MSQIQDTTFDDFGVSLQRSSKVNCLPRYQSQLEAAFEEKVKILDPYQHSIVFDQDIEKPSRITANSGSGKTFCLLMKSLKMVIKDGVSPGSIVLFTFTNKAAREIRERYIEFFENILEPADLSTLEIPQMSTIHSFGCKLLYLFGYRYSILNEYQSVKMIRECMEEITREKVQMSAAKQLHEGIMAMYANNELHLIATLQLHNSGHLQDVRTDDYLHHKLDRYTYSYFASLINGEKNICLNKPDLIDYYANIASVGTEFFKKVVVRYLKIKYSNHMVGFPDMIYLPYLIMLQHESKRTQIWNTYKYLICDESQDNSTDQFSLMFVADQDTYKRRMC